MTKPSQVVLIYGNDRAAIDLACQKVLKEREAQDGQVLDVHRYDAEEMSVNECLTLADSQTLLGGTLAHIFRQPGFLETKPKGGKTSKKHQEALLAYLEAPNPDALIIFTHERDKKPHAFLQKVIKACRTLEADQPEGRSLGLLLDQLAQDHGKKWASDAKHRLLQTQNHLDLGRILQEAEKILLYARGSQVTLQDVETLLAPIPEFTIFQLLDAVFEGRGKAALEAWKDCQAQGEKPGRVIYMLGDQARRLMVLQSLDRQGASMAVMQKQAGRPAFVVKKNLAQARKLSTQSLIACLDLILSKDYERKRRSIDENLFMERLLLGLAGQASPSR